MSLCTRQTHRCPCANSHASLASPAANLQHWNQNKLDVHHACQRHGYGWLTAKRLLQSASLAQHRHPPLLHRVRCRAMSRAADGASLVCMQQICATSGTRARARRRSIAIARNDERSRAHGRGDAAKLWRFLSVLYCSHDAVRPLLNPLYQIAVHCLIWFGLKSQSGRGHNARNN